MIKMSMTKTRVINIKKNPDLVRDPNYIYIGRGSIYGNPFSHLDFATALVKVETREDSIENHKQWLDGKIKLEIEPPTLTEIMLLENGILGCFCKNKDGSGLACHGDTYVEIVERTKREETLEDGSLNMKKISERLERDCKGWSPAQIMEEMMNIVAKHENKREEFRAKDLF